MDIISLVSTAEASVIAVFVIPVAIFVDRKTPTFFRASGDVLSRILKILIARLQSKELSCSP